MDEKRSLGELRDEGMQVQGGIGLTKKLDFSEIAIKGAEYVKEKGSVHDVTFMLWLGATPQSWRVWRPALIDIYSIHTFPK